MPSQLPPLTTPPPLPQQAAPLDQTLRMGGLATLSMPVSLASSEAQTTCSLDWAAEWDAMIKATPPMDNLLQTHDEERSIPPRPPPEPVKTSDPVPQPKRSRGRKNPERLSNGRFQKTNPPASSSTTLTTCFDNHPPLVMKIKPSEYMNLPPDTYVSHFDTVSASSSSAMSVEPTLHDYSYPSFDKLPTFHFPSSEQIATDVLDAAFYKLMPILSQSLLDEYEVRKSLFHKYHKPLLVSHIDACLAKGAPRSYKTLDQLVSACYRILNSSQ